MTRRLSLFVSVLLVVGSLIPANATVRLGSTCKSINQTKTIKGQKLICLKKGSKKIWSKDTRSTSVKDSTPTSTSGSTTPAPQEVVIPDPEVSARSLLAPIAECKLPFVGENSDLFSGFPRNQKYIPAEGDRKSVVLFVDFPDLSADPKAIIEWKNTQVPFAEKAWRSMSYDKYRLKFDLVEKFFRIPSKWQDFVKNEAGNIAGSTPALAMNHQKLIIETLNVADAEVDFSKYDFINIVTPSSTPKVEPGASGGGGFNVDGKRNFLAISGPFDEYQGDPLKASWLAHEAGHLLGLTHVYDFRQRQGAWDLMGNVFANNDIYGWSKFFLAWIGDNQVNCLPKNLAQETTHLITPLGDKVEGTKLVMIPISLTQSIVIESRRSTPLDLIDKNTEGILVYKVDTSIPDGKGTISILSNLNKVARDKRGNEVIVGTMKANESVSTSGYVIKYLKRGETGDFVSIAKS